MKNKLVFFLSILVGINGLAQTDSNKAFTVSAYAELYYTAALQKNIAPEKPVFFYNYKQNNELKINLAFAKVAFSKNAIRANVALMAGDYAVNNLANEKGIAQHMLEANIGVRLSTKNNIWIDVGIMPSYIGFESAIGADCYNLSRSLVAENSPYFFTGVKLSGITKNKKLNWALVYLNGWQKIAIPTTYPLLNFGTQLQYIFNDKLTINYNSFYGSDKPKPNNHFRTYHNVYAQVTASSKTNFIVGVDVGTDKNEFSESGVWLSPILIVKQKISSQLSVAARIEYVKDNKNVYYTHTNNKFKVWGLSANIDYAMSRWCLLRTEIRTLRANNILSVDNQQKNQQWINGALIVRF